MALDHKNIGGNLGAGGGTRFLTYKTEDTRAEVEAAGYFNDLHLTVKVGDGILINAEDQLFQVIVLTANTAAKTVTTRTTQSEGGV